MAPQPSPYQSIPMVAPGQKEEEREYEWGRWLSDPWNEVKAAGKSIKEAVVDPVVEAYQSAERMDENLPKGLVMFGHVVPTDGGEPVPIKSWDNTLQGGARAVTQPLQYLGPAGEAVRQKLVDTSAEVYQVPKEEDLIENPDARRVQGFGQFATETGIAGLATAGTLRLGGAAFGYLSPQVQAALKNPFVGRRFLKWLTIGGIEGAYSGLTQDPYANQAPFSNIQPEDPPALAALKNIPGNIATDAVVGGTLEVGSRVVGKGLNALFPNLSRKTRQQRTAQEVQEARTELEQDGIQEKRPDGTYGFTEEAVTPDPEPNQGSSVKEMLDDYEAQAAQAEEAPAPREIPSSEMEVGGAVMEGDLPDADPGVDPWADPSLPEVDVLKRGVDQLDDQAIQRVAEASNTLEATEAELDAEPELVGMNVRAGSAPTEKVADPFVPFRDQFEALDNNDLLSMAYPDNSPELFRRVQLLTGKEFEQFTRADVLNGIDALANEDGLRLIPSRFSPVDTMLTTDIKTDPGRFQYKEGVDGSGRQIGQSLDKVKKWNVDLEDVVDVWEDPDDGLTYVVNGHNRLALAKKLGVQSLKVNFLNAPKDFQARALGALKNIGQGAGTPFDAAKFIREQGFQTAEELSNAGLPLKSGLAAQGLALSRLPDSVFQRAVNGELSLSKALVLGSSGLSDEAIIRLVRVLDGRDVSDRAFIEMAEMAKTAPVVESDQGGLFGAETLDTIALKAELAGAIRAELMSNKNLFKKVGRGKNVNKLANEAGTTVNEAGASEAASRAQAALGVFDAEKYAAGTEISALLNQATQDVAEGKKTRVVKDRLLREVLGVTEDAPAPAPAPKPEPEPEVAPKKELNFDEKYADTPNEELLQLRKDADKYLLTDRKRQNREKKKAEMDAQYDEWGQWMDAGQPEPMVVTPKPADWNKVVRELDRDAWASQFIEWYDQRQDLPLTPEQRKDLKKKIIKKAIQAKEVRPSATETPVLDDPAQSLEELVVDPINAMREEIRLAGQYAEMDAAVEAAEAQAARVQEGFYEQDLNEQKSKGLLERFPDEPEPEFPEPEGEPSYQLPADVAKSKPRYGLGVVQFGNDLDRAAYIIRSKAKKSKGEDRIIASLEEQGLDVAAVRKHGEKVKKAISDQVLDMTGSRRAPQSSMEIVVPAVPFGAEPLLSPGPNLPVTPRPGRAILEQEAIREALDAEIEAIVGKRPYDKNLLDSGPSDSFPLPKAHGGDGKLMTTAAGRYYSATDVIAIYDLATADRWMLDETAWHESWHRLQFQNLTRKEMAVLNGAKARSRLEEMASLPVIMNAMRVAGKKPSSIEMQAFAFQKYVSYRRAGIEDPFTRTKTDNAWIAQKEALQYADAMGQRVGDMEGDPLLDMFLGVMGKDLTTTFKKFFDKLYTLIERLENFAKGNGFQSVKDVYERAYSGGMARRKKIYDAKLISSLVNSKDPKKLAKGAKLAGISKQRSEFLELWNLDNDPDALNSFLENGSRQIQFERDALIQQAIKEGC